MYPHIALPFLSARASNIMKYFSSLRWLVKCWQAFGGDDVTKNTRGQNTKELMNVLRQSINEAILESNDVAAVVAALKRTGRFPVFSIDISLQAGLEPAAYPMLSVLTEELVLDDSDVAFLAAIGISDPSWCCGTAKSGTA
jgi:hypothetical protein